MHDLKNLFKAFYVLFKHLWEFLADTLIRVINFCGPVFGSVRGVVNPEEFYRVIMLASTGSGGFYGFIQYLSKHANEYITDPTVLVGVNTFIEHVTQKHLIIALFIILFVWDYVRRKFTHGATNENLRRSVNGN